MPGEEESKLENVESNYVIPKEILPRAEFIDDELQL